MTSTWVHPQLSTRLLQDLTKSYMTSTWVHPQLSTRLLQDLTAEEEKYLATDEKHAKR
jgi:hypothetical protein